MERCNRARMPKPPATLSDTSKKFWKAVLAGWELDTNHIRLLQVACEQWDRATEARAAVSEAGAYFSDRHGNIKPHPGLSIEVQARKLFIHALREIGLDAKVLEAPRAPMLPRYSEKESRQGRVC
jgi:phage terminase small subunit